MPAQQRQRVPAVNALVHAFVASSLVTRMFVAPGSRSCTLHV
jgi:hypothetical protein